ncbi:AtzE family amidohydrolase [Roseibium denhamense]|uniref:Aspartyl-tRNA(Asn)/glutamyl-tRNA(Gln) amidotransferase subunit A n=1 Tax=Roseibium denhamense TaxID=76305 RepID=A0ABY1PL49_9HYPH|nr:AtzE family amidohydrolase [Roseibium denhamense]MTI05538.1 AtzE family amidohydrolase [Roseibium denhamense]SMP35139.1 aspartyl-tRNA(Asn)/glutamyl-tRNA(Gln) amidotransferase subunit A [Roseibium denhamense]
MSSAESLLTGNSREIIDAVSSGSISALEVAQASLQRIENLNPRVNAFTDVLADRATRQAAATDKALDKGAQLPLAGLPFAVKNLFDVEGVTTRAGSKINRSNRVARADATLVRKLSAAGATLMGCVHMGEYAYDFTGESAHDGICKNPHDLGRMTGGSSSGSAAACASGMVPLALGSDTNGSIRVPASFCGLFGLKPTYGRLSRHGAYPFVGSLDHVGPLARSADDLAMIFDILQGPDPLDPAQADRAPLETTDLLAKGSDGLRIAVASGYFRQKAEPAALNAVDKVARALGNTVEIDIPEAARARAAAYVITASEGSNLHYTRIRTQPGDFDSETRDRFLAGTMVPSVWVQQAQRFRSWFRKLMQGIFEHIDIILAPATPFPALETGTKTITVDGETMLARPNIGLFTQPISFIGLPAVSVPVWLDGATLPIGVQIIAPAWREDLALRVAHQLEQQKAVSAPIAKPS